MKSILYLTYRENPFTGNKAIIKTQVEELLKVLSNENKVTWMILLSQGDSIDEKRLNRYKDELSKFNINFLPVKCNISSIYTGFIKAKKIVNYYLKSNKIDIIHCRGYIATFISILGSGDEKIIFDMRGVHPQEQFVNGKVPFNYLKYLIWNMVEKLCIKKSDSIIVVTDYFEKYVLSKYNCCNNKVNVIYNGVNTEAIKYSEEWRQRLRTEYNLNDELVIIYCGSIYDKWQSFDKTACVYKKIKSKYRNTKFFILSKDINLDLNKYNLTKEETIIKFVENSEVYKYLSMGDIALLVRDESIINAVAFPVKFTEYMACGLPVIISPSMKGICEIISNKGIIYNGDDTILNNLLNLSKEECIRFSLERLDIKIIARCYQKIYNKL